MTLLAQALPETAHCTGMQHQALNWWLAGRCDGKCICPPVVDPPAVAAAHLLLAGVVLPGRNPLLGSVLVSARLQLTVALPLLAQLLLLHARLSSRLCRSAGGTATRSGLGPRANSRPAHAKFVATVTYSHF